MCGFLNSRPVRTWLGGFLLGKQIGTTIFEFMKVPLYDKNDDDCIALAKISWEAHRDRSGSCSNWFLDEETEADLCSHVRKVCSGRTM